jgi:hypothetical protein
MSRFPIPAIESAAAATAHIYGPVKKVAGARVRKTFAASAYLGPASLTGQLNAETVLHLE